MQKEHKKIWVEYQTTQEQEAYRRLYEKSMEMLSEIARTVLPEVRFTAYAETIILDDSFLPQLLDKNLEMLCQIAYEFTDRDRELLAQLWRAAEAAADSIDPDDETPTGLDMSWGELHLYYGITAEIVEEILE